MVSEASRVRSAAREWQSARRAAAVAYAMVWVLVLIHFGIPTGRMLLAALVVAGLGVTCIGHSWRRFGRVLVDWLPFTLVLMLYDQSRGVASRIGLPLHESDAAHLEARLFGGTVPTVWLQRHFLHVHAVHWYDALASVVYSSHFLATPALAAVLWWRNRRLWISYVARVVVLSFAGVVTYVIFPEAPPWLAAQHHIIGPVQRLSARGWDWFDARSVHTLLGAAQKAGSNPVAAMPSLHTGFAVLVAMFIARQLTSRWRYLLYAYPALMGLALIYTGEHYVIDVVAGAVYAVVASFAVSRFEQRGLRREIAAVEAAALAEEPGAA